MVTHFTIRHCPECGARYGPPEGRPRAWRALTGQRGQILHSSNAALGRIHTGPIHPRFQGSSFLITWTELMEGAHIMTAASIETKHAQ